MNIVHTFTRLELVEHAQQYSVLGHNPTLASIMAYTQSLIDLHIRRRPDYVTFKVWMKEQESPVTIQGYSEYRVNDYGDAIFTDPTHKREVQVIARSSYSRIEPGVPMPEPLFMPAIVHPNDAMKLWKEHALQVGLGNQGRNALYNHYEAVIEHIGLEETV